MNRLQRAGRRLAVPVGILLSLPLVGGCGSSEGKLSGQVLYQGKPLPGGRLTFRPADPRLNSVSVPISAEGTYEATLPVGDVTICVDNRELQPASRPPGEKRLPPGVKLPPPDKTDEAPPPRNEPSRTAGTYVPIPEKYYEAENSGLKHTVKGGAETHNIELQ
jgi:hypothetical protein